MKIKTPIVAGAIFLLCLSACNLGIEPAPTQMDPTLMYFYSNMTVAAIQTQAVIMTQAAGGITNGNPIPATTEAGMPVPTDNQSVPPPASTNTIAPINTNLPTITQTAIPCNWAAFVADVNVPDNWSTAPNASFTKIWRIQNIGTCSWSSGYKLAFDHGDSMGSPATQPVTAGIVASGSTVDISVNMVAPGTAGTYQAFFRLRTPENSIIPFSNSANDWFWVKIKVIAPTSTPNPTPTSTVAATAATPGITQIVSQITVSAGSVGYATANCPAGSVVVGGGFALGGTMVAYTQSMEGNGWRVYGQNNSATDQLLNGYAICLSGTPGTVSQVWQQTSIAAGAYDHVSVSCPAGSVVTGGGFASSPDYEWVYNSSMEGNGWGAYAKNLSGTAQLLNAYAICLTGAGAANSGVSGSVTISAGTYNNVSATCPAGGLASSGGWAMNDGLYIYNSSQNSTSSWIGYAENRGGVGGTLIVYAVCLLFP